MKSSSSYRLAGVDFTRAEECLKTLRERTRSLRDSSTLHPADAFCGLAGIRELRDRLQDPVLIVGSRVASYPNQREASVLSRQTLSTLLAHPVFAHAEPIGFVDSIAMSKLDPETVGSIAEGFVSAIRHAGGTYSLLGGELAELPMLLKANTWLLGVTVLALVERSPLPTDVYSATSERGILRPGEQTISLVPVGLEHLSDPVVGITVDGVGAKSLVPNAEIGLDVVHHGVNDLSVHGVLPLAVLPTFVADQRDEAILHKRLRELERGAQSAASAPLDLCAGHSRVLPEVMQYNTSTLEAVTVGVAERQQLILGQEQIRLGDHVFCLAANGIHTNGATLALTIFEKASLLHRPLDELGGQTPAQVLAVPHRSYAALIETLLNEGRPITGLAHITGGGLRGNVARILPSGCTVQFPIPSRPAIFRLLQRLGKIGETEMRQVFNIGIGLIGTFHGTDAAFMRFCSRIEELNHTVVSTGRVVPGGSIVRFSHPPRTQRP